MELTLEHKLTDLLEQKLEVTVSESNVTIIIDGGNSVIIGHCEFEEICRVYDVYKDAKKRLGG